MYGDWKGVPRNTSPDLADLFDGYYGSKYTQNDIRKGLNAIIGRSRSRKYSSS